jgi:hypothetical protein
MKRSAVVWTASIVVVALGLGGRAGAQTIEILPPECAAAPALAGTVPRSAARGDARDAAGKARPPRHPTDR